MKAAMNIFPLNVDIAFSSRNCLRNWTSGDSSEPKAAVAITQRMVGRDIVLRLVCVSVVMLVELLVEDTIVVVVVWDDEPIVRVVVVSMSEDPVVVEALVVVMEDVCRLVVVTELVELVRLVCFSDVVVVDDS